MHNPTYFIATGEVDYLRLHLLNRTYNPRAQSFLLEKGLRAGQHVLEIGCGFGEMACWLAKQVGNKGTVTAIDINLDQLTIAEKIAKENHIKNINFIELDVHNIANLKKQFDVIYGRWIFEFIQDYKKILIELIDVLQPHGNLTYEGTNPANVACFSYPYQESVDEWVKFCLSLFKANGLDFDLISHIYEFLRAQQPKDLRLVTNQPIFQTAEEKSILRLAALNFKDAAKKLNILDEPKFDKMITALQESEKNNCIIAGIRNLLISYQK